MGNMTRKHPSLENELAGSGSPKNNHPIGEENQLPTIYFLAAKAIC